MEAAIVVGLAVVIGGAIYVYLAYRSHLLEKILGNRLKRFLPRSRENE